MSDSSLAIDLDDLAIRDDLRYDPFLIDHRPRRGRQN